MGFGGGMGSKEGAALRPALDVLPGGGIMRGAVASLRRVRRGGQEVIVAMSTEETRRTMQAYMDALLSRGDYAQYFSDDVVVSIEGTGQRYEGREAARQWIEAGHSIGEIRYKALFPVEGHAAFEGDFVRNDGTAVPYSVIYDLADGRITALRLYFTGPL